MEDGGTNLITEQPIISLTTEPAAATQPDIPDASNSIASSESAHQDNSSQLTDDTQSEADSEKTVVLVPSQSSELTSSSPSSPGILPTTVSSSLRQDLLCPSYLEESSQDAFSFPKKSGDQEQSVDITPTSSSVAQLILCPSYLEENSNDAFPTEKPETVTSESTKEEMTEKTEADALKEPVPPTPPAAPTRKLTLKLSTRPSVSNLAAKEDSTVAADEKKDGSSGATASVTHSSADTSNNGSATASGMTTSSDDDEQERILTIDTRVAESNGKQTKRKIGRPSSLSKKVKKEDHHDAAQQGEIDEDRDTEETVRGTEIDGFIYEIKKSAKTEAVHHSRRPPRQAAMNNKFIQTKIVYDGPPSDEDDAKTPVVARPRKKTVKPVNPDDPQAKLKKVKAAIAVASKKTGQRSKDSAIARIGKKLGIKK